jgi:hypothetical protein
MRSLFFLLTTFPLASFAFAIGRADYEVEASDNETETTSSEYWLQDRFEGDAFFEYAEPQAFLCPRAQLAAATGISFPILIQPTEMWLTRRGKSPRI